MRIKSTLPQFSNEQVLIIVAGQQKGEFYVAGAGSIDKVAEIKIPNPRYSDREGHFKRRGHGLFFGSGSVREPKNLKVEGKFLNDLRDKVLKIVKKNNSIEKVYIFASEYMLNRVLENLPNRTKDNIVQTFKGNYTKQHPFDILGKIKKKTEEVEGSPPSSEAQKIYNKTEPPENKQEE